MKQSILSLLLVLFTAISAWAGQWQAYTFTDQYRRVVSMGDKLYILKGNSLVRANADTWRIECELNRENGLSDSNIVDICYSHEYNRIAIVYANGLIDILHDDGSIWTITDLYNAPMPAIDKTINSIREQQGLLFLHTAYGFAVVDIERDAILENFNLGLPVRCAWSYGGDWYYSCPSGSYYCPKRNSNPHIASNWHRTCAHIIDRTIVFRQDGIEQCWQMGRDKHLYKIAPQSHTSVRCYDGGGLTDLRRLSHYILAPTADSVVFYDTRLGLAPTDENQLIAGQRIACRQSSPYVNPKVIDACPMSDDGSQFVLLYADRGVLADSIVSVSSRNFRVNAIHPQALTVDNHQQSGLINRIVCNGQGEVAMSYVPSLAMNYSSMLKLNAFLTTVNTATDEWKNYDHHVVADHITTGNQRFVGVTELIADPFNPERYYFSSLEDGITVIDHGTLLARYDATTTNNGLEVCAPKCTRIGGMGFDNEQNLWCFDEGHNYGVRVLRNEDQKWYRFKIEGLEKEYGFTHLCVTRRDGRHQIWGYQQQKYEVSNVFCYDYGDNITNSKDDRFVFFKKLMPDTPGAVPFIPYYGRNIYEGPTGAIWLLNTSGLYIIDSPDLIFDHPGEVHEVMSSVIPTSMAIDGNNNVWISTEGHGIYLFSPDGRQELAHFTSDNSIMNSNEVNSVAYDATQSTLWIATDGQILTYTYDLEEYSHNAHEWTSQAYCYPALITRQTRSMVNVYGLADGSQASVSNSQGRILYQAPAIGGIISIDTQSYPVGIYTISGIDREGHRGELTTFEVEP